MKQIPYEQQAYHNEPIPQGLATFDAMAYLALRGLYSSYRAGEMSKEQAGKEKREIIKCLEQAEFFERLGKHYSKLIKTTETCRRNYRKNPTLENADKLVDVFDGLDRTEYGLEEETTYAK